jgi:thiol:disulfide interchange protein DsbC
MMKHALLAIVTAAAFSSAHGADVEQMRKQLTQRMPGLSIGAITKTPYGDLYEVVANGFNIFYTDEHANIAFIGKAIDLKTKIDIAAERTKELMRVDFAALPLDKAIVKVKGDGSRKMAVFSDPDCPFCHELEQELAKVNDVTIYIFLYPLKELHPDSERKAKLLWCAKDPAQAWDDWMLRGKEPAATDKACDPPLEAVRELAAKYWITGTPGLVFADGQLVAGAVNSEQIERHLASAAKSAPAAQDHAAAAGDSGKRVQ